MEKQEILRIISEQGSSKHIMQNITSLLIRFALTTAGALSLMGI